MVDQQTYVAAYSYDQMHAYAQAVAKRCAAICEERAKAARKLHEDFDDDYDAGRFTALNATALAILAEFGIDGARQEEG